MCPSRALGRRLLLPPGSPRALGRPEARPPELELDPVVWVTCGQGAGLRRPGRESLAFPGALGQGGGPGTPESRSLSVFLCPEVLAEAGAAGGWGHLALCWYRVYTHTDICEHTQTHTHMHTCQDLPRASRRRPQRQHQHGPSPVLRDPTSCVHTPGSNSMPHPAFVPPGVGVGLGQEHQQPPCRLHGSRGHSVTRGPGGDLGIFDASVFWGVPGWLQGPRVGLALPAGRGEGPRPLRWPPRLAHGCGQLTPTAGLAGWAFKRSVQAGS